MEISPSTSAAVRQQHALSDSGNFLRLFRIKIMDDGTDRNEKFKINAVFSVAVLNAADLTVGGDGRFRIAPVRQCSDIGNAGTIYTAAVAAGRARRPQFFEVLVECNGAVSAVARNHLNCYIIDEHSLYVSVDYHTINFGIMEGTPDSPPAQTYAGSRCMRRHRCSLGFGTASDPAHA